MKNNFKILSLLAILAVSLFACKKDKENRSLLAADPGAPALTLNTKGDSIIADPSKLNDSCVTLSWTKPTYGFDALVAYEVEMATKQSELGQKSGTAFVLPITEGMSRVYTNAEILPILKAVGVGPNAKGKMYARVASYLVNSPKRARLNSNVVEVNLFRKGLETPINNELFLVGNADSVNTWNNPVVVPNNKLVRLDDVTYGGVFYLEGGKEFLLLPENGNWDKKYCLNDGDKATAGISEGGNFVYKTAGGDNFLAPANSGWYKISLNFADGKFTITPDAFVPSALWAVGEATPQGWNNGPTDVQKATRTDCNTFEYKQTFEAGKLLKFVSTNGQWQPQYGQKAGSPVGTLDQNLGSGSDPDVITTPAIAGEYTLVLNFFNRTYSFK